MKGLTSQQLLDLDCHVILGNTYHLENRPGSELVAQMKGLHEFIGWPRGMLTDSGGFQVRVCVLQCVNCVGDLGKGWDGGKGCTCVQITISVLSPHKSLGCVNFGAHVGSAGRWAVRGSMASHLLPASPGEQPPW